MKHLLFLYNVSYFDGKCCEIHLSLSLNGFVRTHPLSIVINNQMNSVLSMLGHFSFVPPPSSFKRDWPLIINHSFHVKITLQSYFR